MPETPIQIEKANATLICGVPCETIDTSCGSICVRRADGDVVRLTSREASLLRRMSSSRTFSEWAHIIHHEDLQTCEKSGKRHISAAFSRLAEWFSSLRDKTYSDPAVKTDSSVYRERVAEMTRLLGLDLLAVEGQEFPAIRESTNISVKSDHRIRVVCIPTCSRGERLYRCVDSFSRNLIVNGRSDTSILVIDDSHDRQLQVANREMTRLIQRPNSPSIRFIGDEERERLIDELVAKRIAPLDLIQFALYPKGTKLTTVGAVRNTMMLLTAGSCIFQTDDDTTCAFVPTNAYDGKVRISSSLDPYQTSFFPAREDNLKAFPLSSDIDPLTMHESLLGKSLAGLSAEGKSIVWDRITSDTLASLYAEGSQINVTSGGMSGDSGRRTSLGFLTSAPSDTLRRIYSSAESYRVATNIREIMRSVTARTVCRDVGLQSMTLGVNNTQLMPPFFPVGRNQDGAFAALYYKSSLQFWIGHLPIAISHESEPHRSYDGSSVQSVGRFILTNMIELCISSVSTSPGANVSQSLRCIGEQFVALGLLSPAAFRSFLRTQFVRKQSAAVSSFEDKMCFETAQLPEWRNDIHSVCDSIRRSMFDDVSIVPADLSQELGSAEALEVTQSYILKYGKIMLLWEEIRDAATSICLL